MNQVNPGTLVGGEVWVGPGTLVGGEVWERALITGQLEEAARVVLLTF